MVPDYSGVYSGDDEDREPHATILHRIGPGSKTKKSLVSDLEDEFEADEVKVALLDLIDEGELVEHPEIDNAWMMPRK